MTTELIEAAFEHEANLSFATNALEKGDKVVYLEYRDEAIHGDLIETFAELLDAEEWDVNHYNDGEKPFVRYVIDSGEDSSSKSGDDSK